MGQKVDIAAKWYVLCLSVVMIIVVIASCVYFTLADFPIEVGNKFSSEIDCHYSTFERWKWWKHCHWNGWYLCSIKTECVLYCLKYQCMVKYSCEIFSQQKKACFLIMINFVQDMPEKCHVYCRYHAILYIQEIWRIMISET